MFERYSEVRPKVVRAGGGGLRIRHGQPSNYSAIMALIFLDNRGKITRCLTASGYKPITVMIMALFSFDKNILDYDHNPDNLSCNQTLV